MIPAALASSIVRPFYNRGASGPAPITFTPLGKNVQSGTPLMSLTINGISVSAGETLFAGIVYTPTINVSMVVDVGGAGLAVSTLQLNFGTARRLVLCYITAAQAPYSGNLVFDFSSGIGFPTEASAVVSKVSQLKLAAPIDKSKTASGAISGTQDSGLTAATTQATEFIYGLIGTMGVGGDTVGNWQAGMAAGQSIGGPLTAIKEGWQAVSSIGTYRAEVTGATPRVWGARCDTFKGV